VKRQKTADGYVRVSRRAGREGESFISPEVQRKKIADWAKLHEVEIVKWWEEIDQSGAKLERPQFQRALARCEAGETGGIVVARLDRFARSAVDALESIKRLNEASARLVSVEDNFDGSTPMGRFAIGILTLIAELELERIKENWSTAVTEAVSRGIHISARVPVGYRRELDERGKLGKLVRDEPAATAVRELFRRRAVGASWTDLARYLEEQQVYPSTGNKHWSKFGVASLIKNPVYLGQARSGKIVNDHAHEPLVTRAEFDAAQSATKSLFKAREGSLAAKAMLGGLARCAGCGHTLKIAGNTVRRTGERYPVYYCTGRYASGPCPARATIPAAQLDSYVEAQVLEALQADDGIVAEAARASAELEKAAAAVAEAEHELSLFVTNPKLLTLLGETPFLEGVEARQQALDEARRRLADLRARSSVSAELGDGDLLKRWPKLSVQRKRRLMQGLLEQVILRRRTGALGSDPISDRTQIVLRGGALLNQNSKRSTDAASRRKQKKAGRAS
jgi:site-specific DNA recombinase